MTATRFELDEEKIKANPKYSLEGLYEAIEEAAKFANLKKIEKGYYICEDKNAPACMGIFVFNCMSKVECFTKHLKSWRWYADDEEECGADIITMLQSRNKGIWK